MKSNAAAIGAISLWVVSLIVLLGILSSTYLKIDFLGVTVDFLNKNNGPVTAISTVVLVIVTTVYVFLTYQTTNIYREQLILEKTPNLIVSGSSITRTKNGRFFDSSIVNLGKHTVFIRDAYVSFRNINNQKGFSYDCTQSISPKILFEGKVASCELPNQIYDVDGTSIDKLGDSFTSTFEILFNYGTTGNQYYSLIIPLDAEKLSSDLIQINKVIERKGFTKIIEKLSDDFLEQYGAAE